MFLTTGGEIYNNFYVQARLMRRKTLCRFGEEAFKTL
jgi:hypothetical protein